MPWRGFTAKGAALVLFAVLASASTNRSEAASTLGLGLQAPALIERVQCRNVRDRLILPNGRVEYVTRQECSPGATSTGSGCRVIRERVIRADGSVAYLSRTQC